jgi:hypothetical protein
VSAAVHAHAAPRGLRLPSNAIPRPVESVAWADWQVVTRSHGFHVSREAIDGTRREFLLNDVREVKIFRSGPAAIRACEEANFTGRLERLKREPLLGGNGVAA